MSRVWRQEYASWTRNFCQFGLVNSRPGKRKTNVWIFSSSSRCWSFYDIMMIYSSTPHRMKPWFCGEGLKVYTVNRVWTIASLPPPSVIGLKFCYPSIDMGWFSIKIVILWYRCALISWPYFGVKLSYMFPSCLLKEKKRSEPNMTYNL